MRRFSLVLAIIASLTLASTALAAPSKPKLSFVRGGGGTIAWSTEGGSSPAGGTSNANNQSLRITSPATGSGASAYTYGASEALVGIRGLTLAQIENLGFDSSGYLGAGAPRISLGTLGTDGPHTYFLSAFYCNDPIGTSGWRTSDFVNDATNCTIHRDGVQMTWATAVGIAALNSEVVVSNPNDWFLIVDEGPSVTYVDRLTVQNWMWTGGGKRWTINCNSGDCV